MYTLPLIFMCVAYYYIFKTLWRRTHNLPTGLTSVSMKTMYLPTNNMGRVWFLKPTYFGLDFKAVCYEIDIIIQLLSIRGILMR